MTNNHVIDEKYIKENKLIKISLNDGKEYKDILFDNRIVYSREKYDTTIIELKEKDKINNYLELDKNLFLDNSNLFYEGKSIYAMHYPQGAKLSVSYGILNAIQDFKIKHFCNTETGSSGSPILNLDNNNVIGIHIGGSSHFSFNEGIFLKDPILEFTNDFIGNKTNNNNAIPINNYNINNHNNAPLLINYNLNNNINNNRVQLISNYNLNSHYNTNAPLLLNNYNLNHHYNNYSLNNYIIK